MKKLLIIVAIILLGFSEEKKVKIELTLPETQTLLEGLKRSRIESWQSSELIDKIVSQVNPQIDTTKK